RLDEIAAQRFAQPAPAELEAALWAGVDDPTETSLIAPRLGALVELYARAPEKQAKVLEALVAKAASPAGAAIGEAALADLIDKLHKAAPDYPSHYALFERLAD